MKARVFVTQPVAQSAMDRLRGLAEVECYPDSRQMIGRRALIAAVRRHDILFSLLHDRIDREVITANPRLRAVASMAITPDGIDVAAATAQGIPVTVIPPIVAEATADLAFALMLAVARRIVEGDVLLRGGVFPGAQSAYLLGAPVCGRTLGLVGGGGRIGRALARRARGFDMPVLYWGPRRLAEADEQACGMTHVAFDRLLAQSDFISLHSPLRPETQHQISTREFALMKATAFLINTARGAIVDERALVHALVDKRIAGAGLDVFEHEPRVSAALIKMPNVVLTPHLGSAVADLRDTMANIVVDNIAAVIEGRIPPNCVNPQIYAPGC
jgi:glyoxylate reductase